MDTNTAPPNPPDQAIRGHAEELAWGKWPNRSEWDILTPRPEKREAFIAGFLARDAEGNAALTAVLELHKPEMDVHGYKVCGFRYCYDGGEHGDQHEWPCPTVRAIEKDGA